MTKGALVGVDIGGTKTALVVSLQPPTVLERIEFPTKPAKGPKPALRLIQQGIRDLLSRHRLKSLCENTHYVSFRGAEEPALSGAEGRRGIS